MLIPATEPSQMEKTHCIQSTFQIIQSNQPLLSEAMAHMWQYILNIVYMFKYIVETNCDSTWWMCFFYVFCFRKHISQHEPLPLKLPLSPVSSLKKKHTNKLCFLFVC